MLSPHSDFRFEVALSFAGDNKRDRVRSIATLLKNHLGEGKVFFDEWYEAEIAGVDADQVLQRVYEKEARLVVTCVCQRYNEKSWTQMEWRAIRALEMHLRDAATENVKRLRILPLRFGDGEVDGLYASSISIAPDVRSRSDQAVSELILERLRLAKKNLPLSPQERITIPDAIINRAKRLQKTQKGIASELGVKLTAMRKCWQGDLVDCDLLERLAKTLQCEIGDISKAVDSNTAEKVESTQTEFDIAFGKEQLIPIVASLLTECPEALATIIKFNKIAEQPTALNLARRIVESDEPMGYLFNCVDRRFDIDPSRAIQHRECFLTLAEAMAPICLTTKNLNEVYATIKNSTKPSAGIDTKEPLVAKAVVGLIHGVPVDGDERSTWDRLSSDQLRTGRDFAAAVPEPPELGVRSENIVETFVKGLAIFLNSPPTVGAVKAALKAQLAKKVHLCVLFTEPPNPAALKILKEALEHIILLVGTAPAESDANYYVLEQFRQIRRFFRQ